MLSRVRLTSWLLSKTFNLTLFLGHPMRISALQRLAQSAEAREDPLVAGMVESLMTQLKRAVANRDAGLLEAADTEARLEPDQVVVRGESDGCSRVVFRFLLVWLA